MFVRPPNYFPYINQLRSTNQNPRCLQWCIRAGRGNGWCSRMQAMSHTHTHTYAKWNTLESPTKENSCAAHKTSIRSLRTAAFASGYLRAYAMVHFMAMAIRLSLPQRTNKSNESDGRPSRNGISYRASSIVVVSFFLFFFSWAAFFS